MIIFFAYKELLCVVLPENYKQLTKPKCIKLSSAISHCVYQYTSLGIYKPRNFVLLTK